MTSAIQKAHLVLISTKRLEDNMQKVGEIINNYKTLDLAMSIGLLEKAVLEKEQAKCQRPAGDGVN